MKKISFYINITLIAIAFIVIILSKILNSNNNIDIPYLIFLGLYQIILSIGFTIYSIVINKKLLALHIIYWLLVFLFFKYIFNICFYFCFLIALYNLYINYCSFSISKFNITK